MKKNKPLLPKSSLIIRLVAGMYLIYLAYELGMGLLDATAEGAPTPLIIFAVVAFAGVGLIITITSGKAFLTGEFQGGIMDVSEGTEKEETE